MSTKSFVDAYEQLIRKHNDKVMSANEDSSIIKQADDDKLDLGGDEQGDKQNQDQEEVPLDVDDQDQEEELEGDEDQEDDFNIEDDDELDDQPQSEYNPEQQNIEMNFSIPLAQEFVQTVNTFTKLCAEIVQKRSVPKDTADKLDKYMKKIKNIVSAAEESV